MGKKVLHPGRKPQLLEGEGVLTRHDYRPGKLSNREKREYTARWKANLRKARADGMTTPPPPPPQPRKVPPSPFRDRATSAGWRAYWEGRPCHGSYRMFGRSRCVYQGWHKAMLCDQQGKRAL